MIGIVISGNGDPSLICQNPRVGEAEQTTSFFAPRVIATGEPAALVLLSREGDRYRVERVIAY